VNAPAGQTKYDRRSMETTLTTPRLLDGIAIAAGIKAEVADEVRVWSGQIDGDDARSVALRSLLRYLDPSGSPKVK